MGCRPPGAGTAPGTGVPWSTKSQHKTRTLAMRHGILLVWSAQMGGMKEAVERTIWVHSVLEHITKMWSFSFPSALTSPLRNIRLCMRCYEHIASFDRRVTTRASRQLVQDLHHDILGFVKKNLRKNIEQLNKSVGQTRALQNSDRLKGNTVP